MIALAATRQMTLAPTSGAEVDKVVAEILKAPKELVDRAAEAMK